MKTPEFLTIVGWIVTFALGLISALVIQRKSRERRVLLWTVANESNFLSRDVLAELADDFDLSVRVLVDEKEVADLSTVRLSIVNAGNVDLRNLTLYFDFGKESRIFVGRYLGDLGVYREKLQLLKQRHSAQLVIGHINPAQSFGVEFLVGQYSHEDFSVDMAEPGVELRSNPFLNRGVTSSLLSALLSSAITAQLGGVKYDEGALQTALLVEEVRKMNRILGRLSQERES